MSNDNDEFVIKGAPKLTNYSSIPNYIWIDQRLEMRAKLICAYLAGKGPGWVVRKSDIQKTFPDIKDTKFSEATRELRDAGYLNMKVASGLKTKYSFYRFPHENPRYDGEMPPKYDEMLEYIKPKEKSASAGGPKQNNKSKSSKHSVAPKQKKSSTKRRKNNETVGDFNMNEFD